MSISSSYAFNHEDNIRSDATYNTQQNIQNTNFSKYNLANYHNDSLSQEVVYFTTQNPTMMANGTHRGSGLAGKSVDVESKLHYNIEQERSLEKLDLRQRMFITVPYLGRGAGDTTVESKLQWGESVPKRQTAKETSHEIYSIYPNDKMRNIISKSEHIRDQRVGSNSRYDA